MATRHILAGLARDYEERNGVCDRHPIGGRCRLTPDRGDKRVVQAVGAVDPRLRQDVPAVESHWGKRLPASGGERAFTGCLGKDRSLGESRHSIASTKQPSPPETGLLAAPCPPLQSLPRAVSSVSDRVRLHLVGDIVGLT